MPREDHPMSRSAFRLCALVAVLALLAPTASIARSVAPGSSEAMTTPDASDNVSLVYEYAYDGVVGSGSTPYFSAGTDLAFDGAFVYAPQQGDFGKIRIFERLDDEEAAEAGEPFALRGEIPCAGTQNDVAVVQPGLIAVAYHTARCGTGATAAGRGLSLFDVSDPANPVKLSEVHGLSPELPGNNPGGTHTLTVHPEKPVIYASPGGIANGDGYQEIIDVSDPASPVRMEPFLPNPAGCHDLHVLIRDDGDFGICVGLTQTQIWDLADPFRPEILSVIVNPLIQFHHTGIPTPDGKYLVIGDETLAAQECLGGPTGAMFSYDISNPLTPLPMGYFAIDRNAGDDPLSVQDRTNWCTAHLFNFVGDSYTMVAAWYTGGMNVIDWSDMRAPREVAHYAMDGGDRTNTVNYWSAYWHDRLVYANDRGRGSFDVLAVDGLDAVDGATAMPTSRRGGWSAGSLARVPAGMLVHAQTRQALRTRLGAQPSLACVLVGTDLSVLRGLR
jgi:hypothetical protein